MQLQFDSDSSIVNNMNKKLVLIFLFMTLCNVNALKKVLKRRKTIKHFEPEEPSQIEEPSKSISSVTRNHRNGRCKFYKIIKIVEI